VHIWNLDGTVARVIDVGRALSTEYDGSSELDENGWGMRSMGFGGRRRGGISAVVRDVSWHPYEGVLVCIVGVAILTCLGELELDFDCGRERRCYRACMGRGFRKYPVDFNLTVVLGWAAEDKVLSKGDRVNKGTS
jgi:hypothetical protein